ncbi:MAG: cell division protein ZipA C-terminal FtsZ-binding domain-containing protein [Legionella sp.]|jgi:cell division protein ZipA
MQSNWSLILNVLLLVGVIVAIGRLLKARKGTMHYEAVQAPQNQPKINAYEEQQFNDDIIAVRKVSAEEFLGMDDAFEDENHIEPEVTLIPEPQVAVKPKALSSIVMFLAAKENRQFAGYELLQSVLAAGLRYGEGNLFYRHHDANGQGPVICGLAAATATGTFDLQNIGAFSVRGLCLFMHTSGNPGIDSERFALFLETAKQLSDGLDAILLDDQRNPLTNERLGRYYKMLQADPVETV